MGTIAVANGMPHVFAWQQLLAVNHLSALWLSTALVQAMRSQGQGSNSLSSSIAGLRGNRAIGLYGIAKARLYLCRL